MPILKMLSRQSPQAISQTLTYITRDADNEGLGWLKNLRSEMDDHDGLVEEILKSESYRKITSNRIYCYHTIISLSDKDALHVTPDTLEKITRKYLELRGEIQAVAIPHFDTDSRHVHILESGSLYRSGKSSGLRKESLTQLKQELEAFVQEQFPELEHSLVQHGQNQPYVQEQEFRLLQREGKSKKHELTELIQDLFHRAQSQEQFLAELANEGLVHYERRSDGLPTGIFTESGKKYRFSTLGVTEKQIQELKTIQEQSREQKLLDHLESLRRKGKSHNLNQKP